MSNTFVRTIETNCKGNSSFSLSPLTIVQGRNASGKSGRMAAIELLLTGKTEELGERTSEVFQLGDGSSLWAKGELSNGDKIAYEISTVDGRLHKSWTGSRGVVVSKVINELLLLGDKRAKEIFLSYVDNKEDLPITLTEDEKKIFDMLWSGNLSDMPSALRSRKLGLNRVISSLNVPTNPNAEELGRNIEKAKAGNRLAEINRKILSICRKISRSDVYYATYKQVGEVRRANKNFAHCLACGASQKNYVPDRIVEISYEEMQAWEEIKELKEEAERVEGMFPGCVLLEVKQEILGKMEEEYKGYRHAVVLDRSGLEDLEKEYEAVKELERKVNDKITSSLMRSIAGVEDKVSKLVGERFRIRLDDFAIGYERGNSFFPFSSLSGAERAICSSALACVLANKVVKEDEISAVVIDDVGLDRGSLPALCLMLGRAVADGQIGQAIVCTMTDWGLNIDGWQKVSTDTSGVCDG